MVKFIFPNPHFVFLHDTNHREHFDDKVRTFSSGCIRIEHPCRRCEEYENGLPEGAATSSDSLLDG
jgi:hypothetical protein